MTIYEETVQAIKDFDKIPSASEWNRIAGKYGFLSTKSLRVITGINFVDFCREIRKLI